MAIAWQRTAHCTPCNASQRGNRLRSGCSVRYLQSLSEQVCDLYFEFLDVRNAASPFPPVFIHPNPSASSNSSLLDLPSLWLAVPMTRALSGEAPTVRRSSAVTFAVAAVLQAEPAKGNRPLLTRTLKALFAAADDCSSGSGKSWRCRVHALNCLRLLFNSSTLGAHMLQWVEQGLLCAFSGFRFANTTPSCSNACQ